MIPSTFWTFWCRCKAVFVMVAHLRAVTAYSRFFAGAGKVPLFLTIKTSLLSFASISPRPALYRFLLLLLRTRLFFEVKDHGAIFFLAEVDSTNQSYPPVNYRWRFADAGAFIHILMDVGAILTEPEHLQRAHSFLSWLQP